MVKTGEISAKSKEKVVKRKEVRLGEMNDFFLQCAISYISTYRLLYPLYLVGVQVGLFQLQIVQIVGDLVLVLHRQDEHLGCHPTKNRN